MSEPQQQPQGDQGDQEEQEQPPAPPPQRRRLRIYINDRDEEWYELPSETNHSNDPPLYNPWSNEVIDLTADELQEEEEDEKKAATAAVSTAAAALAEDEDEEEVWEEEPDATDEELAAEQAEDEAAASSRTTRSVGAARSSLLHFSQGFSRTVLEQYHLMRHGANGFSEPINRQLFVCTYTGAADASSAYPQTGVTYNRLRGIRSLGFRQVRDIVLSDTRTVTVPIDQRFAFVERVGGPIRYQTFDEILQQPAITPVLVVAMPLLSLSTLQQPAAPPSTTSRRRTGRSSSAAASTVPAAVSHAIPPIAAPSSFSLAAPQQPLPLPQPQQQQPQRASATPALTAMNWSFIGCPWRRRFAGLQLSFHSPGSALRTMAFFRLLGWAVTDGHFARTGSTVFSLGHSIDVSAVKHDIRTIIGRPIAIHVYFPAVEIKGSTYNLTVPRSLGNALFAASGQRERGRRATQQYTFPPWIIDEHGVSPLPIPALREFIAGLFGGDGYTAYLFTPTQLTPFRFKWVKAKQEDLVESLLENMQQLINLFAQLGFNFEATLEEAPTEQDGTEHNEVRIAQPTEDRLRFYQEIGFRLSDQKIKRAAIAAAADLIRLRVVELCISTFNTAFGPHGRGVKRHWKAAKRRTFATQPLHADDRRKLLSYSQFQHSKARMRSEGRQQYYQSVSYGDAVGRMRALHWFTPHIEQRFALAIAKERAREARRAQQRREAQRQEAAADFATAQSAAMQAIGGPRVGQRRLQRPITFVADEEDEEDGQEFKVEEIIAPASMPRGSPSYITPRTTRLQETIYLTIDTVLRCGTGSALLASSTVRTEEVFELILEPSEEENEGINAVAVVVHGNYDECVMN